MEMISSKKAYYVKLGQAGTWAKSSFKKNIIRIGWPHQSLADINLGKWGKIQQQLEAQTSDKGTATRSCRALKTLCESTPEDLWITFHDARLWWCKVAEGEILEDNISKFRKVDRWCSENIFGESLLITQIPGRIAKTQGFQATICKVKEVDELVRLINRQASVEYTAILHSKMALCQHVESGLRRLHWKDFETLVDLVFRATGWRRVSVLGETMKFSDIELEEPITGEMYQVQVKSTATPKDLKHYADSFSGGKYRKLFFVVHTPDKRVSSVALPEDDSVQLVLPERLAEMVVEAGLLGWLMNKIR